MLVGGGCGSSGGRIVFVCYGEYVVFVRCGYLRWVSGAVTLGFAGSGGEEVVHGVGDGYAGGWP